MATDGAKVVSSRVRGAGGAADARAPEAGDCLVERYHLLVADAPEGSLGAQMRKFYDDARFDIPGTPGAPLPVEFLGSHDVHHVLAGYDTS
ncbi:MAG: hypothetical protein WCJ30_29560, partial [Deltaproteobacteria bacterium]